MKDIQYPKDVYYPSSVPQNSSNPNYNPCRIFPRYRQIDYKIYVELQKALEQPKQSCRQKKNKFKRTLHDFKTYCKTMVIKIVWE